MPVVWDMIAVSVVPWVDHSDLCCCAVLLHMLSAMMPKGICFSLHFSQQLQSAKAFGLVSLCATFAMNYAGSGLCYADEFRRALSGLHWPVASVVLVSKT